VAAHARLALRGLARGLDLRTCWLGAGESRQGPDAQQRWKIATTRKPSEREARVVPPPLHYETSRPPDADFYPRGTRVEHDPAFIEPFAGSYQTATGSGRYGLSGWTAPNLPIGSESTNWREINGWFALGFR